MMGVHSVNGIAKKWYWSLILHHTLNQVKTKYKSYM